MAQAQQARAAQPRVQWAGEHPANNWQASPPEEQHWIKMQLVHFTRTVVVNRAPIREVMFLGTRASLGPVYSYQQRDAAGVAIGAAVHTPKHTEEIGTAAAGVEKLAKFTAEHRDIVTIGRCGTTNHPYAAMTRSACLADLLYRVILAAVGPALVAAAPVRVLDLAGSRKRWFEVHTPNTVHVHTKNPRYKETRLPPQLDQYSDCACKCPNDCPACRTAPDFVTIVHCYEPEVRVEAARWASRGVPTYLILDNRLYESGVLHDQEVRVELHENKVFAYTDGRLRGPRMEPRYGHAEPKFLEEGTEVLDGIAVSYVPYGVRGDTGIYQMIVGADLEPPPRSKAFGEAGPEGLTAAEWGELLASTDRLRGQTHDVYIRTVSTILGHWVAALIHSGLGPDTASRKRDIAYRALIARVSSGGEIARDIAWQAREGIDAAASASRKQDPNWVDPSLRKLSAPEYARVAVSRAETGQWDLRFDGVAYTTWRFRMALLLRVLFVTLVEEVAIWSVVALSYHHATWVLVARLAVLGFEVWHIKGSLILQLRRSSAHLLFLAISLARVRAGVVDAATNVFIWHAAYNISVSFWLVQRNIEKAVRRRSEGAVAVTGMSSLRAQWAAVVDIALQPLWERPKERVREEQALLVGEQLAFERVGWPIGVPPEVPGVAPPEHLVQRLLDDAVDAAFDGGPLRSYLRLISPKFGMACITRIHWATLAEEVFVFIFGVLLVFALRAQRNSVPLACMMGAVRMVICGVEWMQQDLVWEERRTLLAVHMVLSVLGGMAGLVDQYVPMVLVGVFDVRGLLVYGLVVFMIGLHCAYNCFAFGQWQVSVLRFTANNAAHIGPDTRLRPATAAMANILGQAVWAIARALHAAWAPHIVDQFKEHNGMSGQETRHAYELLQRAFPACGRWHPEPFNVREVRLGDAVPVIKSKRPDAPYSTLHTLRRLRARENVRPEYDRAVGGSPGRIYLGYMPSWPPCIVNPNLGEAVMCRLLFEAPLNHPARDRNIDHCWYLDTLVELAETDVGIFIGLTTPEVSRTFEEERMHPGAYRQDQKEQLLEGREGRGPALPSAMTKTAEFCHAGRAVPDGQLGANYFDDVAKKNRVITASTPIEWADMLVPIKALYRWAARTFTASNRAVYAPQYSPAEWGAIFTKWVDAGITHVCETDRANYDANQGFLAQFFIAVLLCLVVVDNQGANEAAIRILLTKVSVKLGQYLVLIGWFEKSGRLTTTVANTLRRLLESFRVWARLAAQDGKRETDYVHQVMAAGDDELTALKPQAAGVSTERYKDEFESLFGARPTGAIKGIFQSSFCSAMPWVVPIVDTAVGPTRYVYVTLMGRIMYKLGASCMNGTPQRVRLQLARSVAACWRLYRHVPVLRVVAHHYMSSAGAVEEQAAANLVDGHISWAMRQASRVPDILSTEESLRANYALMNIRYGQRDWSTIEAEIRLDLAQQLGEWLIQESQAGSVRAGRAMPHACVFKLRHPIFRTIMEVEETEFGAPDLAEGHNSRLDESFAGTKGGEDRDFDDPTFTSAPR